MSGCAAPFHHPARPRPSRADACPPRSSDRRPVSRSRRAGVQTRHRQATFCSGEVPPTRVAGSANVRPPARRWARRLSGSHRRCRKGRTREGPMTDGLRRQGRRAGLRPGQACGLRRTVPPRDCRVQSGSASRSSGVMRASTALRTSGPALCSMAFQSAVLWMVATMRRCIS